MSSLIKTEFKLKSKNNNRQFLADLTIINNNEKVPLIVFTHGFKGFKDWGHFDAMASSFAAEGIAFLKFNFSHNGTTIKNPSDFDDLNAFGENNFTKELNDLDTIFDFVEKELTVHFPIDLADITLMGHSRGGGISIIKAQEDARINRLITLAALNNFKMGVDKQALEHWQNEGKIYIDNARTQQKMPLHYQLYEDYIANASRYDPLAKMEKMDKPVLIVHGDKDPTVPVDHAFELKKQNPDAELLIIEGGDHVFGGTHPFTEKKLHPHIQTVIGKAVSFIKN